MENKDCLVSGQIITDTDLQLAAVATEIRPLQTPEPGI